MTQVRLRRFVTPPAGQPAGFDQFLMTDVASLFDIRGGLNEGTYFPGTSDTGALPGSVMNVVSSNFTASTAGQTYMNQDYDGARVSVTAANVTFRNCIFRGDNSANALVTCSNAGCVNAQFYDCTFLPRIARNDTNGIAGHDFKLYRCDLSHCIDLISPSNFNRWTAEGDGFPIGVEVHACYLHDLAWWTAATGGVVHPTDTETHNDVCQIVGGDGLVISGSTILAYFARQYAHWQVTNPSVEPYSTITLGSLSDGGPHQGIPQRGITGGSLTPGNEANGRYNWDDLSGLMLNSTQGPTTGVTFIDNLCGGGNYFVNGGGNPYPGAGANLGSFLRNQFINDQGDYGSTLGGTNGHTLDFGGTWAGHVTAPTTGADKNFYFGTSNAVTVRT